VDEAFDEPIIVDDVDVDFSDPNIRGASGSVFHAGTDEDRTDYIQWSEEGMSKQDATQKLAQRIARRWESVTEIMPEGDVRTFTLTLPGDPEGTLVNRPRYVISKSTYIYTKLSMRRGGSPPFYWSPGVSFFMLDNWTQPELDEFASFHGVAGVSTLQVADEEADALIALAISNTARNTIPLPSTS
jgi:hypothetical protein